MNGVSWKDLCCLFCCPPCPSSIASKLAFLPPEATYSFLPTPDNKLSLHLSKQAEWNFSDQELKLIEVFMVRTSRSNNVACMHIRGGEENYFTILFSHGNAVDLGQMCSFLVGLSSRIHCDFLAYDYSGYGVSTGKASEKNIYADIQAVFQALITRYEVSTERIILYGQSIGTVPTIHLAAKQKTAAVVLHSALMSGMSVILPSSNKTSCLDVFPSINRVPLIESPVLVMHGTEDEVVDIRHGLAIFHKCLHTLEPLWIEGAGHNDLELYSAYLHRLNKLVNHDLPRT